MRILICDDDREYILELKRLCDNYFEKTGIVAELVVTTEAEKIVEFDPDILLLDIEMPGLNGIAIKNFLCRRNEKPLIIFVSSHSEYMPRAFGRNVVNFITKPATQFHIDTSLELAMGLLPKDTMIKLDSGKTVSSGGIVYVTVDNVYTDVYLTSGEILKNQRRSLSGWTELLQAFDFIRISDQCLVNCRYIEAIEQENVILEDDLGILKISRRRKTACREYYRNYCTRMARLV